MRRSSKGTIPSCAASRLSSAAPVADMEVLVELAAQYHLIEVSGHSCKYHFKVGEALAT